MWYLSICLCVAVAVFAADLRAGESMVYVGTYTGPNSQGIYVYRFDSKTGQLAPLGLAGEVANPSFLAIHPNRKFLCAVSELWGADGVKAGAVTAFAIQADGKLKLISQQASGGRGPCHLVIDKTGRNVLVAHYGSGTATVLPISENGQLGAVSSAIQHHGSGPNKGRQEGPHAHSINVDPANRFAFVADLGLDKLMIYRFDPAKGTLSPNDPPFVATAAGAGPRHFAFHPSGRFAYLITEMGNTIVACDYDASRGALKDLQTVPTLPADFTGESTTAEIQVHPGGKFVYGSNRGHDSIAIFRVDAATGKLTPSGHQGTGGKTPRNFRIDPTGQWLIAANQRSGNLVTFRIDQATGQLTQTSAADAPSPVCVKFLDE